MPFRRSVDADDSASVTNRRVLVALLTALVIASVGCGGDGEPSATSTSSTSTRVPATVNTTTAPPPTATSTTVRDDSKEITAAFTVFFDGRETSIDKKVAVLEDGEKYRSMLVDAAANSQFQQLSVQIRSIRLLSEGECRAASLAARCAIVTHDLLVGAFPALVAKDSPAVLVDGRWKVGAKAWCDVVSIGGAKCPA